MVAIGVLLAGTAGDKIWPDMTEFALTGCGSPQLDLLYRLCLFAAPPFSVTR